MAELPELSPGLIEFIESMGRYFERFGLARIGGRILGLLLISDRPLSHDDIASMLQVSRASVSTNLHMLAASSLAERVTYPGDRRDYYRYGPDTWERALITELEGVQWLRRIGERGMAAASASEGTARDRLEVLLKFCDLLMEDRPKTIERWHALLETMQARNAISSDGAEVHKRG